MTQEAINSLTKKRWVILLASCFINLCIGSLYAWSVFAGPMSVELNGVQLAIVFTIANAVGPITMIPGGSINDKIGPRWCIFIGGLVFGLGMFLSGFATSTTFLIITYGLGCGLGMGLVYGCTIGNSVKFFPDKRGLIGGLATASYGISSVLIPFIANAVMDAMGVRASFKVLGIAFLVIICGCAFLISACPAGFAPAGWKPKAAANAPKVESKTWRQMLTDPIFYVMIFMLTCGAVFGLMVISNAKTVAVEMAGFTNAAAVTIVSVIALFNTAGRVVAGYVSDKIGRINTLTIAMALAVVALIMLFFAGSTYAVFCIAICMLGICFGTFMGVYPGFTADQFGPKNNTVNYGIMFIGFSIAGIVGPTILTSIKSATGKYEYAFLVACGLAVCGLALSVVYRIMSRKRA